jgi:hypothetical protein
VPISLAGSAAGHVQSRCVSNKGGRPILFHSEKWLIKPAFHARLNWSFETAPNPDSRDMILSRMEVFRAVAAN